MNAAAVKPSSAGFWIGLGLTVAVITAIFCAGVVLIVLRRAPVWLIGPLIIGFNGTILPLAFWAKAKRNGGACRPRYPTGAMRRYLLRLMPAMGVYLVLLFISVYVERHLHPAGVLTWVIALAPAAPLLFAILAVGLYLVEEEDEFKRMQMTQGFVIATGMMLAFCTVWGFLETFGLAPHIPLWATFPILAVCIPPAQLIVWWRYR